MEELLAERYRLIEPIGRGGFGQVHRALDEQLEREVAVKLVDVRDRSEHDAQDVAERFRREAVTTAQIEHPNVVSIYDVGQVDEKAELYIVMELLKGHSLREEFVRHGPLAPGRAHKLFLGALDGLAAAHELGVVHKDLKPANLFLHHAGSDRERLVVVDFGIARMDSLTKLTQTGRIVGSPRYLAPEYIMGEAVTPALDVYQMALIIAEALSGEPCIARGLPDVDACTRHVLGELDLHGDVRNSEFGPVLLRAMRRRREERFENATAFADALRAVDPGTMPDSVSKTVRLPAVTPESAAADESVELSAQQTTDMIERLRATERMRSVPVIVSDLPKREEESSKGMSGTVIFLFVLIFLAILAPNLITHIIAATAPKEREAGSITTCLLACTKAYADQNQVAVCQDECRRGSTR